MVTDLLTVAAVAGEVLALPLVLDRLDLRLLARRERIRACQEAGRDPGSLVYSAAQTVCCGRDEAEVARRAQAIGYQVDDLTRSGLAGSPAQMVDKLGQFADAGATRVYLQVLDLHDLGHLELIAAEVMPQAA